MLVLDAVAGDIVGETTIRKSRFVAVLARVSCSDDAAALLARVRAAHPTARHACWAHTFGSGPRAVARCSDDGEPGGTAGPPILAALQSREVVDAGIVVARYFGGVKLGAGGLVRAYGGGAGAVLDAAPLRPARPVALIRVAVPIADAGRVEPVLRGLGDMDAATFSVATVEFAVQVDAAAADDVCDRLLSLTSGAAEVLDVAHRLA